MINEILALTRTLVSFKTVNNRVGEKKRCLDQIADSFGEDFVVSYYFANGFPSLLLANNRLQQFDVILSGHIDVVEAGRDQFVTREANGKLFGRGVYDMKGAVAAMLFAVQHCLKDGLEKNVAVLITSDEEISGRNGTGHVLQTSNLTAPFALIPDGGTNWQIITQQKGFMQIKICFYGKSSHSARPWLSVNPIHLGINFLQKCQKSFPFPKDEEDWLTSVVATKILSSSESLNCIPNSASFFMDVRYVDESDRQALLDFLKKEVQLPSTFDIIEENSALDTTSNHPYIQILRNTASNVLEREVSLGKECGTSDAVFFTQHGIPSALIRPLGGDAHGVSEWVDIKSLYQFYLLVRKFLHSI